MSDKKKMLKLKRVASRYVSFNEKEPLDQFISRLALEKAELLKECPVTVGDVIFRVDHDTCSYECDGCGGLSFYLEAEWTETREETDKEFRRRLKRQEKALLQKEKRLISEQKAKEQQREHNRRLYEQLKQEFEGQ